MSKYSEQSVDNIQHENNALKTFVYIDGANLEKGVMKTSWKLDLERFFVWLKEKHNADSVYFFVGFLAHCQERYKTLQKIGYKLIFKETYRTAEKKIKGNCDAELILKAVSETYEMNIDRGVLVSGDGDFSCLIDFWKTKNVEARIVAPNRNFCSLFLRRKNVSLTYLEDLQAKCEKPPLETKH
jgi:uncharacterized LabA/DUF88 family protein